MYDSDMVAFIGSFKDLGVMKWAKHFEFEKLIGSQLLHMYIGAVGYGGTAIDCEKSRIDASFFTRGEISARFFDNKYNVLSVSGEIEKKR